MSDVGLIRNQNRLTFDEKVLITEIEKLEAEIIGLKDLENLRVSVIRKLKAENKALKEVEKKYKSIK